MKVTIGVVLLVVSLGIWAKSPYTGTILIATQYDYPTLVNRLDKAIGDNGMAVVSRASATLGAKSLGVKIPGNMVVMAFNPKFAIQMLKASIEAGYEAPIRFYVTEQANGKASLSYRTPSSLFAPYKSADLDKMANELDVIFEKIAQQATR